MEPVVVVGAGVAGVTAARTLAAAGIDVRVLDRGHRVGGRMASRRHAGRVVDIGASYFTVSDDVFAEVVADWEGRGLARAWTDTLVVAHGGDLEPKSGPVRWAAPGGLRSLVEDLASDLDVRRTTVERVGPGPTVDGVAASAVVLAMPDPQARRLLGPEGGRAARPLGDAHPPAPATPDPAYAGLVARLDDPFEPVLALTAAWAEGGWPALDGAFVAGDPVLGWVADDGRRRGDGAPVLVAHSTGSFAAEHLAAPDEAAGPMVVALRDVLGIATEPVSTHVHRWTFAKPTGSRTERFFLDDASGGLVGVCGDAFSDRPRVEAAFLSGRAVGAELVARLSAR